jgi:hypothetical protein
MSEAQPPKNQRFERDTGAKSGIIPQIDGLAENLR